MWEQTCCPDKLWHMGMETPPRSSQSTLGEILRSGGGPLCFTGDSTMSPLLLSDSSSSLGSGRYDPYVVAQTGVFTHFPPIALLPGVLAKVHQRESRLLLIAPRWPTRIWFSDLISLLDGSPWAIPVRRDLLSQAQGTVFHPRPELWNLHVWPLRGTNWEMLGFRPT